MTPTERYCSDWRFNVLVNAMLHEIEERHATEAELREAVTLAMRFHQRGRPHGYRGLQVCAFAPAAHGYYFGWFCPRCAREVVTPCR